MPSVGPNSAGAGSQGGLFGSATWNNPGNIVSLNDVYATCTLDPAEPLTEGGPHQSRYLVASSFGFTPEVPDEAIITGFELEISAKVNENSLEQRWVRAQIVDARGTPIGTAQNPNILLTKTNSYHLTGSPSSLFGCSGLTGADLEGDDFGFQVAFETTSHFFTISVIVSVDHARMTVHYTLGGHAKSKTMTAGRLSRYISGGLVN